MRKSIINFMVPFFLLISSCGTFNKDQYSVIQQYKNSQSVEISSREYPIKIENNQLFFKGSVLFVEFEDLNLKPLADCGFIWPSLFETGEINESIKSKSISEMTNNERLLYETTRIDSLSIFVEEVKKLTTKNKRVLKLYVSSPNMYISKIYFAVYKQVKKAPVLLDHKCQNELLTEFKYFGIE